MRVIALMAVAAVLAACGDGQAAKAGADGASGSAGSTRPQPLSEHRTFREWQVSCDNVGTCYAFGHAVEGPGWVRIRMEAGPDAVPEVAVGFWPEDGDFGGAMTVRVGDAVFPARLRTGEYAPPAATVDPETARALVDAMAQGATLSLHAGSDTVPVSLSGAAASLLWIDERQGRLDSVTALIRKGNKPAASTPAAPPTPRVTPAPAMVQRGYGDQAGQVVPAAIESLPAVVQCRAETAFNPDLQKVISSARLDANTILWSIPCGVGAYNFASAYFLTTPQGTDPRRVLFPAAAGEPRDLLVNAAYDPASRVIDAFNKGRGLGDCGVAESWTWTTEGFVLRSASEMRECWGVPSEYWPASWVTE